jgi:gliding motility-associated-like protein
LLSANTNGLVTDILWSSNNNFNDTLSVDSVLLVSNPQYYFVKVRNGNCEAIDSVELQTQNIDITLSGNFIICLGDSAFVKATNLLPSVPLIKYDWSPNTNFNFSTDSSSVWFFPGSSIWVFVEVKNQDGCILKDSVFVAVNTYPIIDSIWASKNPIYKGESTTLNIQANHNILWEVGDTANQIEVAPISDSLFRVEVYSDFGCRIFDSIYIQILDVFCNEEKIKIPTAFTPNNLSPNNTYRIVDNDGIITSFKLEIFNRFGQKVYASTDKLGEWDGTFQNELLAPQVFDFYLHLECFGDKKLFKKGNITLIR